MVTQSPSRNAVLVALIFALSCFAVTLYVWVSFGGKVPLQAKKYEFHAVFANAAQLSTNADVRISGVNVGKVTQVVQRGERSEATIDLTPAYAPISTDAHAVLRSKTLLGETFVEVTAGSPSAPRLGDGGTLALANVEPAQGVDEVLGAFDAPTRQAFKQFVLQTSASLAGRGGDLNAALGNADPAVNRLGALVGALDEQRPAVGSLVRDSGQLLSGLAQRPGDLQTLVRSGDALLSATAMRDTALQATVRALPPFLAELRATFPVLDATASDAAPTLHALRPVAPLLRPALDEAPALADGLRRTFLGLEPVISAAQVGLPATATLTGAARPLFDALGPAARQVVPLIALVSQYRQELVATFANMSAATNAAVTNPDGTRSHYLRFLLPINNESPIGASSQRLGTNRANPYVAPGGLRGIERGGLAAFDCRHTANPTPVPPLGGVAPCLTQVPWSFQGVARSFPRVQAGP